MNSYLIDLRDIDRNLFSLAGGKGANLGELTHIENIHVPNGFCITTETYKRVVKAAPELDALLERLNTLRLEDRNGIREDSARIRGLIEDIAIPGDISDRLLHRLRPPGETQPWAVRSSATAEDLPTASFAGQQDSYLNITGTDAILRHVSRCWASLFSERAVTYRLQNGIDHRKVDMAVIIQQMVLPRVSGILFTADPLSSNRKVLSIDAGLGLGEALVSGQVNADNYQVREDAVTAKKMRQGRQVLSDEEILQLASIGRTIERHFGRPQDIEWCLAEDEFYIVQSRPITTLFPIPKATDRENHVYVSVGHQQMMTDAMKPLGISFWQMTTARPMFPAGGRLFVDITQQLSSPTGRKMMIDVLGKSDPLIKDALTTIVERDDFVTLRPDPEKETGRPLPAFQTLTDFDPAVVQQLIRGFETSIAGLKENITSKTGPALFAFILEDIDHLKKLLLDPQSFGVIMTAMNASTWVNEKMEEWLGEKNVADALSQSVPGNITSEMGLELMHVADVIRPYPEVIDLLQTVKDEHFLDRLDKLAGGREAREAIQNYLDKYGMRCPGEIDITKTRWSEKPSMLVPPILSNIRSFESNAGQRKFEQGLQTAIKTEENILHRLRQLPDGEKLAEETERMIRRVRRFIGYREYPKFAMVSRYFVYKQALIKEAERLVEAGVLTAIEDIYFLSFEELYETARTQRLDARIVARRKEAFDVYKKLRPPRVITSDGEIVTGAYKRGGLPPDAIPGLAVSSGSVEGRARVIANMEEADLEKGDILVTAYTDPSWTPLFVSIAGLVTEVGGPMTHGAVIAREYGLPAVVGVENATRLIRDGQRIRVQGSEGYVQLL